MLVHFVPSMPMLLNWLRPLVKRKKLPDTCMKHRAADSFDGKPAFAQTFFDQSAWTTMLPDWFPAIPRLPINLFAQQGCTYEGYSECGLAAVAAHACIDGSGGRALRAAPRGLAR